ncbi:MAG: alkaline phosphatase family protein [Pseudomonadota bacterium]|nr:alkaline phosphatase family protein [Pseudomonadota bacterium]
MSKQRWLLAGFGAVALALTVLSVDRPAPPAPGADPLQGEAHALLEQVYDVTKWSLKVPAEWAAARLVSAGLTTWLATLPLDPAVRARVDARLGAKDTVDELVPFALFVKEMYDRPDVEDFETWARTNVPRDGTPGLEHTLFSFTPKAAAEGGGGGLPAEQAARLITLYDAVYLQDAPGAAITGAAAAAGNLTCDTMDEASLAARTTRAAPIVEDLLGGLAEGMEPGDMRDAVGHVLRDATTLDAVTLTLIEFVDMEVCKHYRIFSARVQRERQLAAWLEAEIVTPGRVDGWAWLRWHGARRHAVHVVVDGLQGHLVEALAKGAPSDPFLTRVVEEETTEAAARPTLRSTTAGPAMATGFLHHAVTTGTPGLLPFFAALYSSPGIARNGISTTPTISVRNLPIAKTGAPVAGAGATGIPNFHFVDRDFVLDGVQQGRPWYFYGNDALQLTALTRAAGMKTLFDRFERFVTMSCGGQYDEAARYSFDSLLSLAVGEASRDFGDLRCVGELRERATNEVRIAELRRQLLAREALLRDEPRPWEWYDRWVQSNERDVARGLVAEIAALEPVSMPDYLLYYNPWPDHFAHAKGPFSDEILSPTGELRRLDYWLGQLDAAYDTARVSDTTVWGMAGDHGLTPVRWIVSPEAEVIGGLETAGVKLVVKKISSDEGEGPKLTHRLHPPSVRGVDVVVASTAGGNYMMDFFVDQGDNWARQPVLADLRALRTLGGKTIDVVSEVVTRLGDTLDYLVVRETPCTVDGGTVRVMARRGVGTIERHGERTWYGWEGADPLGLDVLSPYQVVETPLLAEVTALRARCVAAARTQVATWCTEDEWRNLTRVNKRVDAVNQLAHLYDTDRAGTINLFPRDGVGYNTKVPGRHAGESFHEKDAFVGIWGEPVTGDQRVEVAINGAVPMAMARWITGAPTTEGVDGWGYPALPESLFREE